MTMMLAQIDWGNLFRTYGITIGWAIAGGIGMSLGLTIALKVFTFLSPGIDEWDLVKQGNVPIGLILSAVVLGTSIVIAVCVKA